MSDLLLGLDFLLSLFIPNAYAQAAGAPPGGGMMPLIMLVGMFVIFYFLLIRPQQKQVKAHRELVAQLKKNDEVIVNGGMIAKLTEVGETYVTAQIADSVEVKYQREAVQTVLPKGTFKKA